MEESMLFYTLQSQPLTGVRFQQFGQQVLANAIAFG
jgi:hypothetical protein